MHVEVTIVALAGNDYKISQYVRNAYEGRLKAHIDIVRDEEATGTASALRLVKDKIKVR
jgi:hypothetical protein